MASALMIACAAAAQTPGFWLTGLTPGGTGGSVRGLSLNGGVAVGATGNGDITPGFSWTAAGGRYDFGLQPGLPLHTPAFGVSSTGNTIVGWMHDGPGVPLRRAYRRVGSGPLQDLGVLPGQTRSYANGVSGDGSTVVGAAEHGLKGFPSGEAFRWTEAGGMQGIGHLRPNSIWSAANGISRDGTTIVGVSKSSDYEAFSWTLSGGMQALPGFAGAPIESSAEAVNSSGSIIVGEASHPDGHTHAVRWVNGELQDLGIFGSFNWRALAVSDSGDVIGGSRSSTASTAFIWTSSTGMLDASDFLSLHGVATPLNYRLEYVYAISGDGLTFGGQARNLLTNRPEGFVATIPSSGVVVVLLAAPIVCPRRRRA